MVEMTSSRRKYLLGGSAALLTNMAGCIGSFTQDEGDYPSENIEAVVPWSAGGGADAYTRNVMPKVAEILDTDSSVINVTGASGLRGVDEVYQSDPDGYTVLFMAPPEMEVASLTQNPDFDLTNLTPLGLYATGGRYVFGVNTDVTGTNDMDEIIQLYRNDELSVMGVQDLGGISSAISLRLRDDPEIDLAWEDSTAYQGSGPLIEALASEEVPAGIFVDAAAQGGLPDGVEAIAVLDSEESDFPSFEGTPSISEFGYPSADLLAVLTQGFYFPPDTPADIQESFAEALEEAVQSDELQNWSDESGFPLGPYVGPEEAADRTEGLLDEVPDAIDIDELTAIAEGN